MDLDDSSAASSWLDDALRDHQPDLSSLLWDNEAVQGKMVDDPISLFGRFVSAVSSDTSAHIETQSRVSPVMQLFWPSE
jgi:Zn-dependent M28 family amino/carboxypeptidase